MLVAGIHDSEEGYAAFCLGRTELRSIQDSLWKKQNPVPEKVELINGLKSGKVERISRDLSAVLIKKFCK